LTDYLQREIGASPGRPFRGRAATFSGFAGKPPGLRSIWGDLDVLQLDGQFHNEHRLAGLWTFSIPTLQENSEFTSPGVYAIASRLLSRPGDVQTRNFIWLTRPHVPTLRLFGIRYLIWDQPDPPEVEDRVVERYGANKENVLKVVEVEGSNINGYSPTEIVPIESATQIVDRLRAGFDPARQVMVQARDARLIKGPLHEAQNSEIVPERGAIAVRATSDDYALLVIPYEFSHCMKIVPQHRTAAPTLLRTNLVNTGIGFRGRLDARIEFHFGPIGDSYCRFYDLLDIRKLKVNKVPAPR
jgi:hypothetical protein